MADTASPAHPAVRSRPAEPEGFRDYVVARQQQLLAAAFLLTGDRHSAEDLVQTVLVKVWPRWGRIVAGGDPDPYVRRALVNTYCSWWKRFGRETAVADPAGVAGDRSHPPAEAALGRIVDRTAVLPLLRGLPRRQRAVVVLRHYYDMSEAATAEALSCSPGTVKSQHAKAMAKLRDLAARTEESSERGER